MQNSVTLTTGMFFPPPTGEVLIVWIVSDLGQVGQKGSTSVDMIVSNIFFSLSSLLGLACLEAGEGAESAQMLAVTGHHEIPTGLSQAPQHVGLDIVQISRSFYPEIFGAARTWVLA